MLQSLALESDGPHGEILTWGEKSPLPFYHGHQPAAAGPLLPPVRVRTPGSEAILLTPLLSVQLCVVCGQWTAFYLDKYDREKHRAQFLDFVEGHSNDHKDLEPLRTWAARISEAKAQATATPQADPDERREPDPERFRDFQHEFEPPVYLARQVADFLRTHDRGVLVLTGPGGVGKSWATEGLDHAGMLPAQLGRAVPLLSVSMHGPTAPRASTVRTALDEDARRVKRWQVPAWQRFFPCGGKLVKIHLARQVGVLVGKVLPRMLSWPCVYSAAPLKRSRAGTPTCSLSRTWLPSSPSRASTHPLLPCSTSSATTSSPGGSARPANAGWKSRGRTTRPRRRRGCERRCKRARLWNWRPSRWR